MTMPYTETKNVTSMRHLTKQSKYFKDFNINSILPSDYKMFETNGKLSMLRYQETWLYLDNIVCIKVCKDVTMTHSQPRASSFNNNFRRKINFFPKNKFITRF